MPPMLFALAFFHNLANGSQHWLRSCKIEALRFDFPLLRQAAEPLCAIWTQRTSRLRQNMRLVYLTFTIILTACNSNTEVVEKFGDGKPKKTIEHFGGDSTCEKTYHENGKLKEIKCFKNGKQTGEQIYFREDGTMAAVMTFSNGIRHGQTYEYYPSGQVAFEGIVENGEFEGLSKWYFKNGQLNFIGNRHLGKDTGWWYFFNMQGDTIRRTYTKSVNDTTQYFDGKGKRITSEEWENITREE